MSTSIYVDPLLGNDRNRCPTCGQYFKSGASFAKHRAGEYSALIPGLSPARYTQSSRRCLSPDQMREIGMGENASGYWVTSLMDEADIAQAAKRWAKLKESAQ